MKILFFCRRFWPLIGGVEKHVLEISRRLIERGHEVVVVTENSEEVREETGEIDGIKIYRIPITVSEKKKKFQVWEWLWKNRQLIDEADVVHCHDLFYWFLPFKFLYPRKKVFTTFHGYEGSQPPKWNKILSHKMAGLLSLGTMAIGDWHEKWYRVKSDVVSYGAVGPPFVPPTVGTSEGQEYDFCFVGRLAEDTGIMVYLEALKILNERGETHSLIVCGDGPQRQEAKNFVNENKLKVTFLGFVKDPQVLVFQSKMVFVSRYLAILETFLAKKLIFAVYDSLIKKDYLELAPFASWIVIEKDAVALANKISYFADRPGKSAMDIQKSFAWAKQQTWDKLTNQYLELWGKLKFR